MLEILISLFIILVGMLGVAALLPVGRYEMVAAAKASRAAACAQAAMRDMVVRGMLDQSQWIGIDFAIPGMADMPVAIDPIGVEYHKQQFGTAPFTLFPATWIGNAPPKSVYRVSVLAIPYGGSSPTRRDLTRRMFHSRDDLTFEIPDERTERPRQVFRLANSNLPLIELGYGPATTAAELASNPTMNSPEEVADAEAAYSWLATVSPVLNEAGLSAVQRKKYSVSVVVFHNRDVAFDRELSCGVQLLGPGDAWLFVPDPAPAGYDAGAVREKLMALKQGDWILLRGVKDQSPLVPGTIYALKWYRVVALGDFVPASVLFPGGSRLVTLAGPDWDTSFATEAGLFDRVVGVYTQTVEVDR